MAPHRAQGAGSLERQSAGPRRWLMAVTARAAGLDPHSVLGRAARVPLRALRGRQVPIVQGPLRGTRWVVGSGLHSCWLGTYEHQKQLMFADLLRTGDVVYDVGAHAGFYTLLAAKIVGPTGHVYAFEPLDHNLANLREHVRINRVDNVTVLACAVSGGPGRARFQEGRTSSTGRLCGCGQREVETMGLDDACAAGVIRPPSVMKVDVEGAEGAVLEGATQLLGTYGPKIFLATHGDRVHACCCSLLARFDYRLLPIDERPAGTARELVAVPARSNQGM